MSGNLGTLNLFASADPGNIRVSGQLVGKIKWGVYNEPSFLHFDALPGGFDYYRRQMPGILFPMVYLESIEIATSHRNKGYAKAALQSVMRREKRKGAKTAFLRVGYHESEEASASENRQKNIRLYQSLGFQLLENAANHIEIPFMWHPMVRVPKPTHAVKVTKPATPIPCYNLAAQAGFNGTPPAKESPWREGEQLISHFFQDKLGQVFELRDLFKISSLRRCAPGRDRTCDQRIRNPLLYPLSYGCF
jgi:GNAT superfamily N-acetyltransferase